jgi:pyridinium-3,5-bisthiocarboxylic acid mononucleotide nickel chelatase
MLVAYLDCATGISGDMTLAALIDAGVDSDVVQAALDSLGLPDVRLRVEETRKAGFRAARVWIDHPPQHAHRNLSDIQELIRQAAGLTPIQKQNALAIFEAIGRAEAHVHGMSLDEVHFHEVGAIDSIADIVGTAVGFSLLGVDHIICSAVPTGRGKIKIAHGVCSVPAPATAELLAGVPLAEVDVEAELTTPTGAGILATLVDEFRPGLPAMTIERIGYGAGTRDLPGRANLLRLIVGEMAPVRETEQVVLLETNLDDVSGEILGHAREILMQAGALEVYTTAIQMKKNRPGTMLSVIAPPADADVLESLIFQETGTLGLRRRTVERSLRQREAVVVSTPWGDVSGKLAWRDAEPARFTPEFDSCAELAQGAGVPLLDVYRAAEAAFLFGSEHESDGSTDPIDHDHDDSHDHSHDHHHDHDH